MKDKAEVFCLYASCIPVQGARRSIICDVQRGDYELIPNILYEILTVHRGKTLGDLTAVYGQGYEAEIKNYFDFLISKDLGIYTSSPEDFPALDLRWQNASNITNALIDREAQSDYDLKLLANQLDLLNCQSLQIRCFYPAALEELFFMLDDVYYSKLFSIYLLTACDTEVDLMDYVALQERYPKLMQIVVHSCSSPWLAAARQKGEFDSIVLTSQVFDGEQHCGAISPEQFRINLPLFSESQGHNTCLNRKISIDTRGYIKNCPALPTNYGHVDDTSLAQALSTADFKQHWYISKAEIKVCQDCEFRHICTDCRAFRQDDSDLYSKPLKCGYDPYALTWEEDQVPKTIKK